MKLLNKYTQASFAAVSVELAVAELKRGRMLVLRDGEERQGQGDVLIAAEHVTPQAINFMAREARGLICLALDPGRCDELGLVPMSRRGETPAEGGFTVSIEAREGVGTGISAKDRAHTIRTAIDPDRGRDDLVQPGHIFPLRARPGGVLARSGHAEAAIDLIQLGGLQPGAVLCEILDEDGEMAGEEVLAGFGERHGLRTVSVADLIAYRRRSESLIEPTGRTALATFAGQFEIRAFRSSIDGSEHLALVHGDVAAEDDVLVRVQVACPAGESFGSLECDCGARLRASMEAIAAAGKGVIVHLSPSRGDAGPVERIAAHAAPSAGPDGRAEVRLFGLGAQILAELGLSTIRLLTDSPKQVVALEGYGLEIVEQLPTSGEGETLEGVA